MIKNFTALLFIILPFFLISCDGGLFGNSLYDKMPKDINSLGHIWNYLLIIYFRVFIIWILFSRVFGIKININLILLILFLYIYFSNDFGFLKLFVITFLPNIFYLIYLYLKKLYSTK